MKFFLKFNFNKFNTLSLGNILGINKTLKNWRVKKVASNIFDLEMTEEEIAEEIEWYINEKFGKEYDDIYIVKDRHSGEEEVVWFDHGVSENLSYIVLHHLMGEDMDYPSGLEEIPAQQWREWLNEYDRPEQICSCSYGCRRCLGTEY